MRLTYHTLAATTVIVLAGCGGGTTSNTTLPVATSTPAPAAIAPQAPPAAQPPAVTVSTDLQSFAAAWISYNMVQTVPALQLTAGATAVCPAGGAARYDGASGTETLTSCAIRQFPEHTYTGSYAVTDLASNADRSRTSASIAASAITVATAATGAAEFTLESGDIGGNVVDSSAGDVYYFASRALSFRAGQASHYIVSNAGATAITILVSNGVPDRTTTNLVFTTSNGANTWQVQTMSPVHEANTARPDSGTLLITRLGAMQALSVTFGPNNSFTLSGGEDGPASRRYEWSDSAVQAAISAGHQ